MNTAVSLKERVLAAAAATPSLTRREGKRLAWQLVALSVIVGISLLELAGGIAHSRDRPLAVTVRLSDGWALASSLLTWLVLRRRLTLASFPRLLVAATLATPVALFAWMGHFAGTAVEPPGAADWPCFVFTLAAAATPLGCFLRLHRGVELERPDALGAAAGAASGAWAGVLALLWCPLTSPWHALIGHVSPIAVTTAVGSVLGAATLGVGKWSWVGNTSRRRT
jgi:hypothetical protein